MRFKTWPAAALGLGALLAVIVVSMLASTRRAQEIYLSLDQLNTYHRKLDTNLQSLRTDVRKTEIVARDYLLDLERGRFEVEPGLVADYRGRLVALRRSSAATLAELRRLAEGDTDKTIGLESKLEDDWNDTDKTLGLESKLEDYWNTFDPLLALTPAAVRQGETRFLRRAMVPRREAILAFTREIEELNNANLVAQRAAVARRQATFRDDSRRLLWESVSLGMLLALIAVFRLRTLERRSEQQRATSEEAERQMRQLSQQLVAAQEEERKHLSRELHDHVAQVLTALRMELSRIERTRTSADARIGVAVAECKGLVDNMFRTVRDLTLGLRPSMLDDFGLQPALEWQVRDLMQRYNVRVALQMKGDLEGLPDRYRTCVYRAVQEALTNCVRHAQARTIQVAVTQQADRLEVSVTDDGIGIDAARRRSGLGLRGIEERVKELHGAMTISGDRHRGTSLVIDLPLPTSAATEVPLARIAG